jgi:hypothetical protein
MSEMGMVERVARALCRESEIYPEDQWERLAGWAVAAIEAMREPTEAMTKKAWGVFPEGQPDGGYVNTPEVATELWQAMLDAALTTSPST